VLLAILILALLTAAALAALYWFQRRASISAPDEVDFAPEEQHVYSPHNSQLFSRSVRSDMSAS
jgi:hypothetical protein